MLRQARVRRIGWDKYKDRSVYCSHMGQLGSWKLGRSSFWRSRTSLEAEPRRKMTLNGSNYE